MKVIRITFSKFTKFGFDCHVLLHSVNCNLSIVFREALRELGFGLKLISSAEDFKQAHVVIFSDSGCIELAVQVHIAWIVLWWWDYDFC